MFKLPIIILSFTFLSGPVAMAENNWYGGSGSYRPSDQQFGSGHNGSSSTFIQAPSQREAWTAAQSYNQQPNYGGQYPGYAAPYPQRAPRAYPERRQFNRSFNINPTDIMDDMFGFGASRDYETPYYDPYPYGYYPQGSYPGYNQGYNYSYPGANTQMQPSVQPPYPSYPAADAMPSKPKPPPRPLSRQLGQDNSSGSRFRPPELTGTP